MVLGAIFILIPLELDFNLAALGSFFFENNSAVLSRLTVNIPIIVSLQDKLLF